ncbi:mannitol dehydrogenase family protein [Modestobacter sp. SSW1-42]|uniref:mannitol dehydrogenase family protein n=1 Tax=Modestobacter sp. SSW1-42 TaxID=596372 RepID=UPI00398854BD
MAQYASSAEPTATEPTATEPTATEPVPLNDGTLPRHAGRVQVPSYDRSALVPSVVHVSVGGFTRAHQLVYLDELAERGETGWGVVGVGLHTPQMRDALAPQDNLFTVVERDAAGEHARVVGSMVDYVFAPDDPARVLDLLADERTRVVTMTVTGSAYRIDPQTGAFTPDEEALADLEHPDRPSSVFGHLVEGLDRRRRAGLPPFTVLSCDNMQSNGEAARTAVVGFARLRDEVLARWIADHVSFPSSMVDRITPATSPEERDEIASRLGVDDRWPVVTEPWSQWVVEDAFCNGRPPLETVGVRMVTDVARFELMKTRLLNAGHVVLGFLGQVAGLRTTDEAVADPAVHDYLSALMGAEIIPLLPGPDGVDLAEYRAALLQRFANPAISDQLSRLSRRGSQKMPDFVLPSLHQALAEGRPHALLTLAVAGWARYLQGVDETGRPLEVQDARAGRLQELARAGGTDPRPLLSERTLFGDLADDEGFVARLQSALEQLTRDGVRATLATHVATEPTPAACTDTAEQLPA